MVWLRDTPRELLPERRRRGFHTGFSDEPGDCPRLDRIVAQRCSREMKAAQLRAWLAAVAAEASAHPGAAPAIWLPAADSDEDARALIEEACGGRLVERSGTTLAEVLGHPAEQVVLGIERIEVPHREGFNGALLPLPQGGFLLVYLLSAMGLTVLVVWPQTGPSAWLRDRALRRALPTAAREVLDCYICCGFWCGLALSPLWWHAGHHLWCWSGCLATPVLSWLVLGKASE